MDELQDIYTPIQNFLVNKLGYDSQKVIINYQNESLPELPFIGMYIETIDIQDDTEQENTEDGLLITNTLSGTMYIDFYGNTNIDVIKLIKLLKTDNIKAELRTAGISLKHSSEIKSFTRIEQENEYLERYQILLYFSMTSSFIDNTAIEVDETKVEVDLELTKDGIYTGNVKPVLDDIVTIRQ